MEIQNEHKHTLKLGFKNKHENMAISKQYPIQKKQKSWKNNSNIRGVQPKNCE